MTRALSGRDLRFGPAAAPHRSAKVPVMGQLILARWQFGITTVYHFLFVPLTIGLSVLVAGMQTAWVRSDNPRYLRMTRFWGSLFLVNFV